MKVPILLPNIFNHPFTYESNLNLKVGDYVMVPFGKSKITGVVWDNFEKNSNKSFKVRKIIRKLEIPNLKKKTLQFLNWFSEYNIVPKGMALKLVLLSGKAVEKLDKKYILSGSLERHGKSTSVSVETYIIKDDNMMKFNGIFDVNADDFGIDIPKIVRNKVSDTVNISFDFQLIKKGD